MNRRNLILFCSEYLYVCRCAHSRTRLELNIWCVTGPQIEAALYFVCRPLIPKKGFVNERAKMKESRLNYRKIRVQDDSITENTNARSPLTFCCLHAKPKDTKKTRETCSFRVQRKGQEIFWVAMASLAPP